MPVFRRPSRRLALFGLTTGLIATASLAGCQHMSPLTLATTGPRPTSDVETAFTNNSPQSTGSQVFEAPQLSAPAAEPQSIWTAPPLADYAFEHVDAPAAAAPAAGEQPAADAEQAADGSDQAAADGDTGRLVDTGIASTYGEGDGFQGRRTACGQRFDTNVPQVAHKTLPCGTMVRVEDTTTGKSVVAEVTDRGPYVKGRVVDLSWAAFSQLHPTTPDLLSVKVYVING
jgi:rare lipoprotein A